MFSRGVFMEVLKSYNRAVYEKRYGVYKRFAFVYYLLFFLAVIAGAVVTTNSLITESGSRAFDGFLQSFYAFGENDLANAFGYSLTPLIMLSVIMVAGITVYAPIAGGVCVILRGAELGCAVRFYCETLLYIDSALFFITDSIYYIFTGIILSLYGSFVSSVSVKLFSQHIGDDSMFGGSLFYSAYFKRKVNIRFLVMYILIYLFSALFMLLCAYGKSYLFGRLIQ